MFSCKICGSIQSESAYHGPIRVGRFGTLSAEAQDIYRCAGCQAMNLDIELAAGYYTSEEYRKEVDGSGDTDHYFKLHDGEQLRHLSITGTQDFRGKVIADIGCGAGSFLDFVKGTAQTCVAVEPLQGFQQSLKSRGYHVFPYAAEAAREFKSKVDLATSFSVVEHIEDPLTFLKDIGNLLRSGGQVILSTPNRDDVLMKMLPEVYPSFFYRKAHLWYFDEASLKRLAELAGFKHIEIIFRQRFGLGNFINWIREKVPKGDGSFDFISPTLNEIWKQELESKKVCDYLFLKAIAP